MNILIASSRGGGIGGHVNHDTTVISHVHPGATINKLTSIAKSSIPPPQHTDAPIHTYLLTGITDITTKINGWDNNGNKYTECKYTGNPETTINRIKEELTTFEKTVKEMNSIPIFCTITNMNITKYNNHLRNTKKTHTLLHETQYDTMQTHITDIISKLNYFIIGKNKDNNMSTPYFHSVIRTKKGNKKRKHYYYSDNWDGLYDGIHGNYNTRANWGKCLSRAIDLNRGNTNRTTKRKASTSSDEATHSPKRSWRRERMASH